MGKVIIPGGWCEYLFLGDRVAMTKLAGKESEKTLRTCGGSKMKTGTNRGEVKGRARTTKTSASLRNHSEPDVTKGNVFINLEEKRRRCPLLEQSEKYTLGDKILQKGGKQVELDAKRSFRLNKKMLGE